MPIILLLATVMLFSTALTILATVPPPPANQLLGIPDSVFNNLTEPDCRLCHEDPTIVNPGTLPDRHHLLVGQPVQCPSAAPNDICPTADTYACLTCHSVVWDPGSMSYVLQTFRDCLLCHEQVAGQASVHHLTSKAQSQDCKACHGPIDNPGDGHYIPTYPKSMVTPYTGLGTGTDGQGGCAFCHRPGTDNSTGIPIPVYRNADTHHSTGLGLAGQTVTCLLCHSPNGPTVGLDIRYCEKCHGVASLHNIQVDSPNSANIGSIVPGKENAYWGHIGANADCNGCHLNAPITTASAAPYSGAVIPDISGMSRYSVPAGANTTLTITGSAFTNTVQGPTGPIELASNVLLTADNGFSLTLTPGLISESSMNVTIPGTVPEGNYSLRAVKGSKSSNVMALVVVTPVKVTSAKLNRKGTVTISGSGFGAAPSRSYDSGLGVTINGTRCTISSWSNTRIVATSPYAKLNAVVTVKALFGSASSKIRR